MAQLSKSAILEAPLSTEQVFVEQWDGEVTIHEMPVGKRQQLLGHLLNEDGSTKAVTSDIELKLFIAGMHDPEFSEDEAEELQSVSGVAVSEVVQAIMKLNGFSGDAIEEARGES
jgi:hypothetical protein